MKKLQALVKKPLEEILKEAALISEPQLELARMDQSLYINQPIGDIFILRGWVKKETVNFFAEDLHNIYKHGITQKFDYYLHKAGLLTREQVNSILCEQKRLGVKFGSVAVLKGWLKQPTVDFFSTHFYAHNHDDFSLQHRKKIVSKTTRSRIKTETNNRTQKLKQKQNIINSHEQLTDLGYQDIPWIG
jgi:hypothetical protein